MLLINQANLIPSVKNILLCPMQRHLHGISVNDVPKFFLKSPTVSGHMVTILSDDDASPLLILFMLQGVISYFPVQAATLSEYDSDVIPKFQ